MACLQTNHSLLIKRNPHSQSDWLPADSVASHGYDTTECQRDHHVWRRDDRVRHRQGECT